MGILTQLQAESAGLSALYVEDEDAINKQVSTFLKKFFTSVDVCKNGAEGLESFHQKRQDIVITDIAMPIMDGLEMSRAIRELSPSAQIIVTTAHAEQDLLLKAIDIGVDQYVLKPIEPSIFATALLKAIKVIKLEKRTKALSEKISNILNFQDNLIFLTDLDNILLCNLSFLKFFGFKGLKDLKIEEFSFTSRLALDDGYISAANLRELASKLESSKEHTQKAKIVDKSTGKERVFVVKMSALPNEKEQIVSLVDITDFELHFKELEFKATHDPLTRIYNRMKFDSALDAEISRSNRYGDPLSIIKFDIDGLTKLNESFGAALGDTVIMKVSQVVGSLIRQDDMFARYGDDEFVVLALHTELERAFDMAEKLRAKIAAVSFDGIGTVTCSFGVVEYSNGEDADGFLARASKLLKSAKASGKNRVQAYRADSVFEQTQRENILWIDRIKNAIEQELFIPYFQPIVCVKSGQILKYESLARLSENGEIIPPAKFLPPAKLAGLISSITRQIVDKSFRYYQGTDTMFSVNIADYDLREGYLITFLEEKIKHYGIDPSKVVLEILETISVEDTREAINQLRIIKGMGFKLAIDDFGTESSNFSRLLDLDVDIIKIDGCFIKHIDTDQNSQKITESIVAFARSINAEVVAEFVHNKAVFEKIKEYGIDYAQGYYFSEPKPTIQQGVSYGNK